MDRRGEPARNWAESPYLPLVKSPGGGYNRYSYPEETTVEETVTTAPAPIPITNPQARTTIGVQGAAPYDYETRIREIAESVFPSPATPFPVRKTIPVPQRKAPTRPQREIAPAPKRNLKGEGRDAAKAGLVSLLLGSLFGGGLDGGLQAAAGGLSGFGQGADRADAERRRQFEDQQDLSELEYQNALADWQTAVDQIALDREADALTRQESQLDYGAGVDAYGAGFNERSAGFNAGLQGAGVLSGLRGQNQQRDSALANIAMQTPDFLGALGARSKAEQIAGGEALNRAVLGMGGTPTVPVPGAPGLRNLVTGRQEYNPLLKPGLREDLLRAQAAEADANAKLVNPRFDFEKSKFQAGIDQFKAELEFRKWQTGVQIQAEKDLTALRNAAVNAPNGANDIRQFEAYTSRLNALSNTRDRIISAMNRAVVGSDAYTTLKAQLDNVDSESAQIGRAITGMRAQYGLAPEGSQIYTVRPESLAPPVNPVAGIGSGFTTFTPGSYMGVPPVVLTPQGGEFVRPPAPKPAKKQPAKPQARQPKTAPKATPKPVRSGTAGGLDYEIIPD